jgi:hypothetical protein
MYAKRYSTETDYQVIEYFEGGERVVAKDAPDYEDFLLVQLMLPAIEANGRFLSVVDGKLVVDPEKANILAAEETARQESQTKAELREIDIKSIRSIREYIAAKTDAPKWLNKEGKEESLATLNAEAATVRGKL